LKEPTNRSRPIHSTHPHKSTYTMGWLRLVGSLKLYVSFAKEPYKKDYILQKRPIILRSLLIVAAPYIQLHPQQSAHCPMYCILKSQLTTCTVHNRYRADFWRICTSRICCADRVAFCASSITWISSFQFWVLRLRA